MNIEAIDDVVDHALNMQRKHRFSISEGDVRSVVANSAEALDIELSLSEVQSACDKLLAA